MRAWFDTVLNPLIRALTTEATVLAHGNLTWKTEVHRLASLVPVREHLVEEAHPNLDQILCYTRSSMLPLPSTTGVSRPWRRHAAGCRMRCSEASAAGGSR